MPDILAQARIAELLRHLNQLTGREHTRVHPYGKHPLIQMSREGDVDIIARLTELGAIAMSPNFSAPLGAGSHCRLMAI
ncbi:hypothetical protein ACG02S_24065 [Roseateles sp. DC23W]|uniref:Uncharacterized protein n=1 Tax=Pelomonas dachongensis TaxID=3299029 RepID=A0ABW7EWJ5_9BURK